MRNRAFVASCLLVAVATTTTQGDDDVGGVSSRLRRRELNGDSPAVVWSAAGTVLDDVDAKVDAAIPQDTARDSKFDSEVMSRWSYYSKGSKSKSSKSKSKSSKSSKGSDDDDYDCYYYGYGCHHPKPSKYPPHYPPPTHPPPHYYPPPTHHHYPKPRPTPPYHPPPTNPPPPPPPPPQCGMPGLGSCPSGGQCKCKCVPDIFPISTPSPTPESTKHPNSAVPASGVFKGDEAACSAHEACAGMSGNCCPTSIGDMLDCCSMQRK